MKKFSAQFEMSTNRRDEGSNDSEHSEIGCIPRKFLPRIKVAHAARS